MQPLYYYHTNQSGFVSERREYPEDDLCRKYNLLYRMGYRLSTEHDGVSGRLTLVTFAPADERKVKFRTKYERIVDRSDVNETIVKAIVFVYAHEYEMVPVP